MNTNKKEKFINKNNAVHKRFWQIGITTLIENMYEIKYIRNQQNKKTKN